MSNSEKFLKTLSSLIENGILTSKDIQKEISTDLKFKRDKLISKLDLVSREEFEVLKKLVQKQEAAIKLLKKNSISMFGKIAIASFSIFNILPLLLTNSILKKFKDRVFHLSIKYLIGLIVFPLWWTIIFWILYYFFSLLLGIVIVSSLVVFLFLRQFLIIKYK